MTVLKPWTLVMGVALGACGGGGDEGLGDSPPAGTGGADGAPTGGPHPTQGRSDGTAGDADSSTAAGGDASDSRGAVCACLLDEIPRACAFANLHALADCQPPFPCDVATVTCPGGNPDLEACAYEDLEYDAAALRCVLEAARDDVVGRYDLVRAQGGGITTLWLDGNGFALGVTCVPTETGPDLFPSRSTVADASHFAMCLDSETPAAWLDCFWSGFGAAEDAYCD